MAQLNPIVPGSHELLIAALRREARKFEETHKGRLLAYSGGPAHFVLAHGIQYSNPVTPPRKMLAGFCYGNAIMLGAMYGLKYVEGYALAPMRVLIPHAWNTDEHGNLIDSTWGNAGLVYQGVEFALERADDCTWNGDACVLDDYQRGWPLLKEHWHGEPPIEWPKSERLELVRKGNAAQARAWVTLRRAELGL